MTTENLYEIRLKPGHPVGEYRREGLVLNLRDPQYLAKSDLTLAMLEDGNLVITSPEGQRVDSGLEASGAAWDSSLRDRLRRAAETDNCAKCGKFVPASA